MTLKSKESGKDASAAACGTDSRWSEPFDMADAQLAENVALQKENKRLERLWSDDELFAQVTELRDAVDAHQDQRHVAAAITTAAFGIDADTSAVFG